MMRGNCARRRHSTAAVRPDRGGSLSGCGCAVSHQWRAIHWAVPVASSSAVAQRPVWMRPGPAAGLGRSLCTWTLLCWVSSAATVLAAARMAWSFRQLMDRGRVAAGVVVPFTWVPKRTGNRVRVVALAPRHP